MLAWRHKPSSTMVQVMMALRLLDAEPLSKPLLSYCLLEPKEQMSMIFVHFGLNIFSVIKHPNNYAPLAGHTIREAHNTISPINCLYGQKFLSIAYITMTSQWARWRLKSRASPLFTQPFIRAQIKENITAPRHWPLSGEFTGDQ